MRAMWIILLVAVMMMASACNKQEKEQVSKVQEQVSKVQEQFYTFVSKFRGDEDFEVSSSCVNSDSLFVGKVWVHRKVGLIAIIGSQKAVDYGTRYLFFVHGASSVPIIVKSYYDWMHESNPHYLGVTKPEDKVFYLTKGMGDVFYPKGNSYYTSKDIPKDLEQKMYDSFEVAFNAIEKGGSFLNNVEAILDIIDSK